MTERVEVCSLCPTDHTEVLIKHPFPGVAVTPGSVFSRKGKTEPEAVAGSLWGLFTITHDFRLWSLKWICASLIPLFIGSFSIPSYDCQRLPNFWGKKKTKNDKTFLNNFLKCFFFPSHYNFNFIPQFHCFHLCSKLHASDRTSDFNQRIVCGKVKHPQKC